MGITAKELAQKLNISATAVSMALNNKAGVSTETRKYILEEAKKYGYDFSKISMKRKKEGDIYYIIYRKHNAILKYTPIFSELTDGIAEACRENGYRLKTLQIYEKTDDVEKDMEDLRVTGCVGIILLGTEITDSICKSFLKLSIPMVLLDTYFDSVECSSVLINNVQGAYMATNYLIDRCNNKQPGHIRSSYSIPNFVERKNGFTKAIKEHGMSVSKSIIHEVSPSIDGAFSDMLEIIDQGDELASCYFADNDLIAIGAIKALTLRGYKIPNDIKIVGFDNISEAKIISPSLTTIDINRTFMGKMAATQLISQVNSPIPQTLKIGISTRLVKRFST